MTRVPEGADPIRSLQHPLAVQIRKIVRRPQAARRMGLFLLDGPHLIEEALDSPHQPEALVFAPRLESSPRGRKLLERLSDREWPLLRATDDFIDRLAPTGTPQGILGLFRRPAGPPEANLPRVWPEPARGLLLAGLQDPGNVGALARTSRAMGCHVLLTLADGADPYHVRALRASSGALLGMQVAAGVAAEGLAAWAAAERVALVGLDARSGRLVTELPRLIEDPGRPQVLVLGSEGAGIPPAVDRLCAEHVRIPMVPAAESLGVLAAGTIALYEWTMGRDRA
jgi:TrmH family RNA methyltransferase